MTATLTLVHRRQHDLPPSWDGQRVTWDRWLEVRGSLIAHAPADQTACHACGLIDDPLVAVGLVEPTPGATFSSVRVKRTRRSGRAYEATVDVPAWPCLDLVAFRCRGCGHDTVLDQRTGEAWDLDASDYGPTGSTATTGTLW